MADPEIPDPCDVVPVCPVCQAGPLKLAKRMKDMDICLCMNCDLSMTVPHEAWKKAPKR